MNKYSYNGPVMKFDICIDRHWKGQTIAATEDKARSNLIYQCKKQNNMAPNSKITLPGLLILVD